MRQIQKGEDFVIQIPRKLFKTKRVQELLSEINFSSIESKSKASQKDIDKFLLYVKNKRGTAVKGIIERIKDKV